jgi:hypothetical protein
LGSGLGLGAGLAAGLARRAFTFASSWALVTGSP